MAYEHNATFPLPGKKLPHEDPILYVDGIIDADADHVEAFRRIPTDYRGEVVEPMELPETLAQAGALATFLYNEGVVPLFEGIESAAFERPVRAGDELHLNVKVLERGKRSFKAEGVATVDGELACRSVFSGLTMAERIAERYLTGTELVDGRANLPVHNESLPRVPEVLNRDPRDIWLDGVVRASDTESDGFWLPGDEYYEGHHFAGQAVLPGIRQVGALRDLAAYDHIEITPEATEPRFVGIEDVTFSRPIRPGERLDLHVEADPENRYKYLGTVAVGEQVATKATLFFADAT